MSRWLQANYKRKAVDATPQHENIEKQWEAEQWQKELNKPGIVQTVKKEDMPNYDLDYIYDNNKIIIDSSEIPIALDHINEKIIDYIEQNKSRFIKYLDFLLSSKYDESEFIQMLHQEAYTVSGDVIQETKSVIEAVYQDPSSRSQIFTYVVERTIHVLKYNHSLPSEAKVRLENALHTVKGEFKKEIHESRKGEYTIFMIVIILELLIGSIGLVLLTKQTKK